MLLVFGLFYFWRWWWCLFYELLLFFTYLFFLFFGVFNSLHGIFLFPLLFQLFHQTRFFLFLLFFHLFPLLLLFHLFSTILNLFLFFLFLDFLLYHYILKQIFLLAGRFLLLFPFNNQAGINPNLSKLNLLFLAQSLLQFYNIFPQ